MKPALTSLPKIALRLRNLAYHLELLLPPPIGESRLIPLSHKTIPSILLGLQTLRLNSDLIIGWLSYNFIDLWYPLFDSANP